MTKSPRFARAVSIARQVLTEFYLDKAADAPMESLAMAMGVFVKSGRLEKSAGTLAWRGDSGIVTVDSRILELGRRRFTIAHELGHFKLHKNRSAFACTDEMFLPWYRTNSIEPEANAFAAELLMPETIFRDELDGARPSRESIGQASDSFETSLTATCFRFVETECYPCVLFAVVKGRIKWMSKSTRLASLRAKEPGAVLDDTSCAGDYFLNGSIESEGPAEVLSEAWFDEPLDQSMIWELPFYLPRLGMVISLVWLR